MKPPIPKDEPYRLEALRDLEIMDTQDDPFFERLVLLASQILKTPIALISIVEDDRQWFLAKTGLDVDDTSREISFCAHAIHSDIPLIVEDATCDERFADNPLVTGKPGIRFYAGAPLITPEGYRLGTVCAIDSKARKPVAMDIAALKILASISIEAIKLKSESKALRKLSLKREKAESESLINIEEFAHELRNPLCSISGFAELIENDKDNLIPPEKYRYYAANIRESAQHLFQISDKIARAEGMLHNAKSNLEHVEVKDLIERIVLSFDGMAADKKQEIKYHAPNFDVHVTADPTTLRQILINLISNACKYSQKQALIEITLRAHQEKCTIEISDNGPGIPDDVLSDLGRPFLQSQSNPHDEGIGLGLSITLNLARSMGWDFNISRGQGGGTVALIEIPLLNED